jgi:rhodanese-related sulfurtransferase
MHPGWFRDILFAAILIIAGILVTSHATQADPSEKGYRNMKVLNGGIVGWYEKNYPVEGTRIR